MGGQLDPAGAPPSALNANKKASSGNIMESWPSFRSFEPSWAKWNSPFACASGVTSSVQIPASQQQLSSPYSLMIQMHLFIVPLVRTQAYVFCTQKDRDVYCIRIIDSPDLSRMVLPVGMRSRKSLLEGQACVIWPNP